MHCAVHVRRVSCFYNSGFWIKLTSLSLNEENTVMTVMLHVESKYQKISEKVICGISQNYLEIGEAIRLTNVE